MELLNQISDRLKTVYIDNRSYKKIIPAFDSKDTLFYLDPPYWINGERFYQHDFSLEDHKNLREILGGVKGKFVLSYNDCRKVLRLYKGYKMHTTSPVHYSMNNKRSRSRLKSEIIISNFDGASNP